MDHAACAEATVEMWCLVDAKLIARKQTNIDDSIKAQILSESMKLYMTNIINETRDTKYNKPVSEGGDGPTDKQIALISSMGGDPSSIHTKREASSWIEKHKDW